MGDGPFPPNPWGEKVRFQNLAIFGNTWHPDFFPPIFGGKWSDFNFFAFCHETMLDFQIYCLNCFLI